MIPYLPTARPSFSASRAALYRLMLLLFCLSAGHLAPAQWVRKADAIKKRSEVTSVVYDDKLYTFIGFSNSALKVEPSSEVYDPAANTWTLLASMPAGKAVTHQGVALVDHTVWHIGGRVGAHPGPLTSETWIYNINTDSWSPGPGLVDPATGAPLLWGGCGAVLLGRTLHVYGGFVINACNNDQDKYHLTLDVDQWFATGVAAWKNERKPLPMKRCHFATTTLGGKIYALGGQFGHDCGDQDHGFSHVYDPATDSWTQLTSIPTPRSHAEGGVFTADGKIYIVGGQQAKSANTNKVTVFDPAADNGAGAWTEDPAFNLPYNYEGISAKVIGSTFIVSHGGINGSGNTQNQTYTRTIPRNPVRRFGFSAPCLNLNVTAGKTTKGKNLLFTIDEPRTYALSTDAAWLSVTRNGTGTAIPVGVDVEIDVNAAGLAPGTYTGTVTATPTGDGPAYAPASFCVNLTVMASTGSIEVPAEQIFSGVHGTISAAKEIVIRNTGSGPLEITGLAISGTHATAFGLADAPSAPFTVNAGQSAGLRVFFRPSSEPAGALNAVLTITSNDPTRGTVQVGLFGLSATGLQGNNEPPLDQIVKTLGYAINVGGAGLILSTGPEAIGDEVLTPLFTKAGAGPVTIRPVARYSPDDLLEYGYYTTSNGSPLRTKIAIIDVKQEQTLLPQLVAGGATGFDPGSAIFGFYAGATSYAAQITYTEDQLNAGGPLDHAVRIYPLKNRAGQTLANTYLIAFEPASNGDYQDYVFEVGNVKPAGPAANLSTVRINAGGAATTVNGTDWNGCPAPGACSGYVSGGFAYTQQPLPTITGITPPTNQNMMQTEWTGGQTGGIPAGTVAFSYNIPVVNGNYQVRLHFVELNKNGAGLRKFDVNIEGGAKELAGFDIFAEAGGIHKAIFRDFPVSVTDGSVNIDFIRQVENAKISAIEILPAPSTPPSAPITLQAEAALLNQAKVAQNHEGFTGTGFVDYINSSGDFIEWTVEQAGPASAALQFRYANGSASSRSLRLEVNGVVVNANVVFTPTGGWANWSTVQVTAPLGAGVNKIRLVAQGTSGPNVDYLVVGAGSGLKKSFETNGTSPPSFRMTVSPNPASKSAVLTWNDPSGKPSQVQVLNPLGVVVRQFRIAGEQRDKFRIPLTGLPPGLYLIQAQSAARNHTIRLVVQ